LEIAAAIDWAASQNLIPVMVTFTASHREDMDLSWFKEKFKRAWGLFSSGKGWQGLKHKLGIEHWIRAVEPLRSHVAGWHYHYHLLIFIKTDKLLGNDYENLEQVLRGFWLKKLATVGLWGNEHALRVSAHEDVKANYLSKLGSPVTENLQYELTGLENKDQGGITVWELLRSSWKGNPVAGALYVEYVEAMTGDDWITWSNGLKPLVGLHEIPDEVLAENPDEELSPWYSVNDLEMFAVRQTRSQSMLIDLAATSRSTDAVRVFLTNLREMVEKVDYARLVLLRRERVTARANLRLAKMTRDSDNRTHYMQVFQDEIDRLQVEIERLEFHLLDLQMLESQVVSREKQLNTPPDS
jgi:hypothetical protein